MVPHWFLKAAQILGLFPVAGLWSSKCRGLSSGLSFKKYSFQMICSWVTLFLRAWVKITFAKLSSGALKISSNTDQQTAFIGFMTTFCTGVLYQGFSLHQTKRFLKLLKKLEEYDRAWPKLSDTKICCLFLNQNISFLFATTVFPVSLVIGALMNEMDLGPGVQSFRDWYAESSVCAQGTAVTGTIFIFMWSEAATLFPIMQLSYFVRTMEHRLVEIYGALKEHSTSNEISNNFLLKIQKSEGIPSDNKIYAELSLAGKDRIFWKPTSQNRMNFWGMMAKRYLDYTELHSTFVKFSGIYFTVLFPIQTLSCVSIIYLTQATNVFANTAYVEIIFRSITGMCLMRLWGMCNLGHGLAKKHGKILKKVLAEQVEKIGDEEEKFQYDKCLQLVKSVPIRLEACGYFHVGRSNIPTIITALVSYIIVLFQFKSAEDSTSGPGYGNINGSETNK